MFERAAKSKLRNVVALSAVAIALLLVTAGCGGGSVATTGAQVADNSPSTVPSSRVNLTANDLPTSLGSQFGAGATWPGLRVYRSGNVYEAYTDAMDSSWRRLSGGPYSEQDICVTILEDLSTTIPNFTIGDAIIQVYDASGVIRAEVVRQGALRAE
jgi:hypothetical protein